MYLSLKSVGGLSWLLAGFKISPLWNWVWFNKRLSWELNFVNSGGYKIPVEVEVVVIWIFWTCSLTLYLLPGVELNGKWVVLLCVSSSWMEVFQMKNWNAWMFIYPRFIYFILVFVLASLSKAFIIKILQFNLYFFRFHTRLLYYILLLASNTFDGILSSSHLIDNVSCFIVCIRATVKWIFLIWKLIKVIKVHNAKGIQLKLFSFIRTYFYESI